MENENIVMEIEEGRIKIIEERKIERKNVELEKWKKLRKLMKENIEIDKDFLELLDRWMRENNSGRVKRIEMKDGLKKIKRILNENVIDRLMNEREDGESKEIEMIERENKEELNGIVKKIIILRREIIEEDVGWIEEKIKSERDEVMDGILNDEEEGSSIKSEGELEMRGMDERGLKE